MLLLATLLPALARAQTLKPWSPPADSFHTWASEAKSRFKAATGDSATGANYRAYELVGLMARRVLRSLGPANLIQAYAVEPVLDSLGLDVDVRVDPVTPNFVLVMARNPYRFTAVGVGYLYWYRGADLRMQGVLFKGTRRPTMRAWWTGKPAYPYEWAVIGEVPGDDALDFTLFRLSPTGSEWVIQQDEGRTPMLGEPGEASWTDINEDGAPELMSWTRGRTDSLFVECSDCPKLVTERVFVEGPEGFEMLDARLLPSPYASLVLFVRFMRDRKVTSAARLLADPARVKEAEALGFGVTKGRGTWSVEYGEPGVPWAHWLAVRFDGPRGVKRYIVHFVQKEGHWLIQDWIEPKVSRPRSAAPSVEIPSTPPGRPKRVPGATPRR
jgi:hypothetical protein